MRLGTNPAKDAAPLPAYKRHRVVIAVYIPKLEGYYTRSLEVMRLCFESLYLTTNGDVSLTVVSNGSAPEVVQELERMQNAGQIDQLILNSTNRGKIDAVVPAARGTFEELITFADCDVLFKPGWLQATDRIFQAFPECGFVAPMPNPRLAWYHTSATVLGGLAKRELTIERIVPGKDLDRFAYSLGNPYFFDVEHRKRHLVLRRNGVAAVVGCGHFVCTVRREVVNAMPEQPSLTALSGNSEEAWLDLPAEKLGLWRLATDRAYVHHIGNRLSPWVLQEIEQIKSETQQATVDSSGLTQQVLPALAHTWTARVPLRWRQRIARILSRNIIQQLAIRRARS